MVFSMILAARLIAILLSFFVFSEANAQSSRRALHAQDQTAAEDEIRDRTNSGTIGLAAGLLEGAPIHFVAEIARIVNDDSDQGTAAAYSGLLILSRVENEGRVENEVKKFIPHPLALEEMRRGDIDAVVFITSKPVYAFVKGKWDEGFKFLPVDYDQKFQEYYLPAHLDPSDDANLIGPNQSAATISVPTLFATLNWKQDPRDKRTAKFVDTLFSRTGRLKSPGFDSKWKDADLATRAPGLDGYRAAQAWLDHSAERQGASR